jgi:fatty acid desaturase
MSSKTSTTRDIVAPELVRALSERSNFAGLMRAATHLGSAFIVGGIILWVRDTPYWLCAVPLVLLQGFLVSFLFMPLHECMHRTAFRSQTLNLTMGTLASLAIMLPFEYYFLFHWAHHRNTQDPARDPELLVNPPIKSDVGLAIAFSGILQLAGRMRSLLRHALTGAVTYPWVPEGRRKLIATEARIYSLFYLSIVIGALLSRSAAVVWVWFAPLVVGQLLLRPYLLAEHTGCDTGRSALANTRTTYTSSLIRWFAWNMPFHVEHHAYPTVPFHALPRLNAMLAGQIVHPGWGYRNVVREVWAFLRRESVGASTRDTGSEHNARTLG